MRPLFLALLFLVATASAHAQAPKRSPFAGDKRLDTKLTVRWKKVPLSEAVAEIAAATRATLKVDPGVADEPLMASAKEIPARTLMEQIGTLCHYSWVRSGGTPTAPVYQIFQDQASRQEEQDALNAAERQVIDALNKQLAEFQRISKLPPEKLQQEVQRAEQEMEGLFAGGIEGFGKMAGDQKAGKRFLDTWAIRSAGSPMGQALLSLLGGLTPAQWRSLRENEMLVFSSKPSAETMPLPGAITQQLKNARPEMPFPRSIFRTFGGEEAQNAIGKAMDDMQNLWGQAEDVRVTVQLNLTLAGSPTGMLRVTPEPVGESKLGPLFGISGLMMMGMPELYDPPAEDPAARAARFSPDPVLGKKAVLKLPAALPKKPAMPFFPAGLNLGELLPEIEKAYDVRLLADAYTRQATVPVSLASGAPLALYEVLDKVSGQGREWVRDGDVIRLRSKTWAHDRRAEIPIRLLKRWKALREQHNGFTLEDLAEIASSLRDEQVESLMFASMEQEVGDMEVFTTLSTNAGILRLYGSLSPVLKQQLLAGRPVPVRSLLPNQQLYLLQMNRAGNRSMFSFAMGAKPSRRPDQLAQATLSLERKAAERQAATPPPPGAPNALAGFVPQVTVFRITLPGGQKDEYMLITPAPKQPAKPPAAPTPAGGRTQ